MFKISDAALVCCVLVAGCANGGRTDSAMMPEGVFPGADVDTAALYEASQSIGLNATPPPTAQGMARAFADVEYIAGAYNTHARWMGIDGAAQQGMLIARHEIRDVMGIPQATPSQLVVNGLLEVSRADTPQTMQASLANPIFTLGPQATLARLEHTPPLFNTPYAIARLNRASSEPMNGCSRLFC